MTVSATVAITNPLIFPIASHVTAECVEVTDINDAGGAVYPSVTVVVTSVWEVVSDAMLDRFPNATALFNMAIGTDNIDFQALEKRNIQFSGVGQLGSIETAELGIGLLIAISRNLVRNHLFVSNNVWATSNDIPFGYTIQGKRCGIFGLGQVGAAVASRAAGLGMQVSYYSRQPKPVPYQYCDSVLQLARVSDYLVLCCESNADTYHCINGEVLEALGEKGFLINIARGAVVDDDALTDALTEKKIGGAALDVFEAEPAVQPVYRALDNVILSPHMGSRTHDNVENMFRYIAGLVNQVA